jgi:hypothetical protein
MKKDMKTKKKIMMKMKRVAEEEAVADGVLHPGRGKN